MNLKLTYQFDENGHTAEATPDDHIRDLIEQVLFTTPGERVNRPDFGSGLLQLLFQPVSSELVTTTRFLVLNALNHWLGDLVEVSDVEVTLDDARLHVAVTYTVLRTHVTQTARFTHA